MLAMDDSRLWYRREREWEPLYAYLYRLARSEMTEAGVSFNRHDIRMCLDVLGISDQDSIKVLSSALEKKYEDELERDAAQALRLVVNFAGGLSESYSYNFTI